MYFLYCRFIQKIVDTVFENSWELIFRIEADKEAIANRYVPPVVEASQLVQVITYFKYSFFLEYQFNNWTSNILKFKI